MAGSIIDDVPSSRPARSAPTFLQRSLFLWAVPSQSQGTVGHEGSPIRQDMRFLQWSTLARGLPIGLAEHCLELPCCLRPFLSYSPSTQVPGRQCGLKALAASSAPSTNQSLAWLTLFLHGTKVGYQVSTTSFLKTFLTSLR